jgi:predicted nucleic acid-binding protein
VGRLRNSLAAKGLAISTPDAHVAQCALDLGADLLSADAVFRLVARHTKLSLFRL